MRGLLTIIGIGLAFVAIMFFLSFTSLAHYSFFAPRFEAVRRDVFLNTPSYQIGKQQEQAKLEREAKRDLENKLILENVADHVQY